MQKIKINWKTSLPGIIGAVLALLSGIGVFTPEQLAVLQEHSVEIFGSLVAVIGVFARDSDKSSQDNEIRN